MPRPAENLEQVRKLLRDAEDAMTTRQISEHVKCSYQSVHKVLGQMDKEVEVVGKSPSGAFLYRYKPRDVKGASNGSGGARTGARSNGRQTDTSKTFIVPGTTYSVVEVTYTEAGVHVVLEDDAGNRLAAH